MTADQQLLLRILIASAYAAWCSQLISGPPKTLERFRWFKNFEPGQLVMEVTSLHQEAQNEYRIGHLLSVGMEPFHSDEEWEQVKAEWKGQPRPTEKVYRIRTLVHGTEFRWRNADFIRVPENLREFLW